MAVKFSRWYAATSCTGSARQGAKALMRYVLDTHSLSANWGIYNCRNARGTSYTSPHGEGRAIDVGFPLDGGKGSATGYNFVNQLLNSGPSKLGIQAIIYDRKIWSAKSPAGRPYTGVHPHYDHVHVEMTRHAANTLTLATVRKVLGGSSSKYRTYQDRKPTTRTVKLWDSGSDVKDLQRVLNKWYPRLKALKVDGYYGPRTESRVKHLQNKAKIKVDGITGPVTWRTLGYGR